MTAVPILSDSGELRGTENKPPRELEALFEEFQINNFDLLKIVFYLISLKRSQVGATLSFLPNDHEIKDNGVVSTIKKIREWLMQKFGGASNELAPLELVIHFLMQYNQWTKDNLLVLFDEQEEGLEKAGTREGEESLEECCVVEAIGGHGPIVVDRAVYDGSQHYDEFYIDELGCLVSLSFCLDWRAIETALGEYFNFYVISTKEKDGGKKLKMVNVVLDVVINSAPCYTEEIPLSVRHLIEEAGWILEPKMNLLELIKEREEKGEVSVFAKNTKEIVPILVEGDPSKGKINFYRGLVGQLSALLKEGVNFSIIRLEENFMNILYEIQDLDGEAFMRVAKKEGQEIIYIDNQVLLDVLNRFFRESVGLDSEDKTMVLDPLSIGSIISEIRSDGWEFNLSPRNLLFLEKYFVSQMGNKVRKERDSLEFIFDILLEIDRLNQHDNVVFPRVWMPSQTTEVEEWRKNVALYKVFKAQFRYLLGKNCPFFVIKVNAGFFRFLLAENDYGQEIDSCELASKDGEIVVLIAKRESNHQLKNPTHDRTSGHFLPSKIKRLEIREVLGLTIDEIEEKKKDIVVGVSLGNKYFEPEQGNLDLYIKWALKHTRDLALVLIPDTLHAINIFGRSHRMSWNRAIRLAKREGMIIKDHIERFRDHLPLSESERLLILSWEDVAKGEKYDKNRMAIEERFWGDKSSKDSQGGLYDSVMGFTRRVLEKVGRNDMSLDRQEENARYVREELPVLLGGVEFLWENHIRIANLLPYPIIDEPQRLIHRIQRGETFADLRKSLILRKEMSFVQLIDSRNQNS